jgi:protein SCO1/2
MSSSQKTDVNAPPTIVPKLFLGFVVVCSLLALGAALIRRELSAESYMLQNGAPAGGKPLWMSPAFSLTDQVGRIVTKTSLRGAPFVVDFIFTRCATLCPLLTAKLVQLQHRTQGRGLRFVSLSVDPDHDDAAVLRKFASAWNPNEVRWHLFTVPRQTLAELITGYRVTVRRTSDRKNPIIHSDAFFLVDAQGMIRGVYASVDPRELERLTRDALALSASDGAAEPGRFVAGP